MSGPYEQQQAAAHGAPAAGYHQRGQRGADSSTSLSSASSANVYKANAAGAAHQHYAQGAGAAHQHYAQGAGGYGQFVQTAGAYPQYGGATVVGGHRRQGRFHRETYRLPDPGVGHVRQVRRRLATPEPDTIERVYLQRAAQEIVEEITEVPTTPPPRLQERTIVEPAGPPQVIKRVIRVPPRSGHGVAVISGHQHGQPAFGAAAEHFQASGNLLSAGSYGNVQHAGFAQQHTFGGAPGFTGGLDWNAGAAGFGSGHQHAFGGGHQQGFGFGGFSSQGFPAGAGLPPGAFCFQV